MYFEVLQCYCHIWSIGWFSTLSCTLTTFRLKLLLATGLNGVGCFLSNSRAQTAKRRPGFTIRLRTFGHQFKVETNQWLVLFISWWTFQIKSNYSLEKVVFFCSDLRNRSFVISSLNWCSTVSSIEWSNL